MDKLQFAKIVSWISSRDRGPMDSYEIEELNRMVGEPPAKVCWSIDPCAMRALVAAIRDGQKIEAIKQYRSMTGQGLKESKDWVENSFPETFRYAYGADV